ncbi:hypothetical protein EZS27_027078 [termite gut metagenome]|uniref:Uncharacterized protein n=1 Tax=termite gut metagenome TaxID=433724 RepID=A0A5J4QNE7_9ZZZZ
MEKAVLATVLQLLVINLVSAQQPSFDWMQDVGAHTYPQKTQVYNVADYGRKVMPCNFVRNLFKKR